MTEGSGNPLLATIGPSVIRAMYERRRDTSIDLSLGQPTIAPDLQPFGEAMDWIRDNGAPYAPNPGLVDLREAIADLWATQLRCFERLRDQRVARGHLSRGQGAPGSE
jgi:aspartate/methionine/tyrosine aminotransferase